MLPGTKVNLKRRAQKGRIVPLQLLGGKRRRKESPYAQFETMKRRHDGCSTGAESLDPFHRPIDGAKETPYLEQKVEIKDDILRDASGFAVMMPWEAPLMEAHAAFICGGGGVNVLNVGFGMGIVDAAIQRHNPRYHVIVEAHPEVVEKARSFARTRPNVQVIHMKWQEALDPLLSFAPFDGIFWDTYEETVEDFFPLLSKLLKGRSKGSGHTDNDSNGQNSDATGSGGRFSFCNVYQPHDVMRHLAYSSYLKARLQSLGLSCTFEAIECEVGLDNFVAAQANPYWLHDIYLVPKCSWLSSDDGSSMDAGGGGSMGETHNESGLKKLEGTAGNKEDVKLGSVQCKSGQYGARECADGTPLDFLLWTAHFWKVRQAAQRVGQDQGAFTLRKLWAEMKWCLSTSACGGKEHVL